MKPLNKFLTLFLCLILLTQLCSPLTFASEKDIHRIFAHFTAFLGISVDNFLFLPKVIHNFFLGFIVFMNLSTDETKVIHTCG